MAASMALKQPLIRPENKGKLHRRLDVPEGQKIPADKLASALRSQSPAVRKRAVFAKNFGK